ncbi:DNA-directed DNA polymerase [Tanacetum coccineum]|uniref:DNA-directed DNA polymerase n=1 Tax=Tanacetum coccineum TaxID=301880 RepID=A0ABQ5BJ25_9ASTR
MTPAAGIKAIIELSKHSLSWYKEGHFKNNDLNVAFKQINNFEKNMNDIIEEVQMAQHKYKLPDEGRISKLEETLSTFIEESPLEQMPKYAKFMKDLLAQRRRGQSGINKALADLGASISVMSYSMFLRLSLGEIKPTRMCIELANKSTQIPRGITENDIVKINRFVFLVDFVVLDMKEDHKIPIILGRPFLATAHAMINVFNKKISFEVEDETITFDIEKSMRFPPSDDDTCHSVDMIDLSILDHIIMAHPHPPNHADDLPKVVPAQPELSPAMLEPTPFIPEHVLFNEDEDPKEDPEEEPQEEEEFEGYEFEKEGMDINDDDEMDDPEVIHPYEIREGALPPPPAESDSSIAASYKDVDLLHHQVQVLTRQMETRAKTESSILKRLNDGCEFMKVLDSDLKDKIKYNNKLDQSMVTLKDRVISLEEEIEKLREKLKSTKVNDTSPQVDRDRGGKDLYRVRVWVHEQYGVDVPQGVVEERPKEATDVVTTLGDTQPLEP